MLCLNIRTYRRISVRSSLGIIGRHRSRRWPAGRGPVARRRLVVAIGIAVWRRTTRLQQGIECGCRAWCLWRRLARKEPLLRRRPRFTGKSRPRGIIRVRTLWVSILAVLVRPRPFAAPVVAGRLATVAWLPRIGRHRRFTLCVHNAIGRNAPYALVSAVL